jgi:hypothetical protein
MVELVQTDPDTLEPSKKEAKLTELAGVLSRAPHPTKQRWQATADLSGDGVGNAADAEVSASRYIAEGGRQERQAQDLAELEQAFYADFFALPHEEQVSLAKMTLALPPKERLRLVKQAWDRS